MNIELEFLEQVRNFHKINNQIMELNPVIFLDRDNAPADELLDKNNLTRKDVKHHNAEYYPSGQVKMKILYLGTWGKRKCYECGWLDYDEQGNQIVN